MAAGVSGGSEVYFSPGYKCWQAIVRVLEAATRTVDICVFTITDDKIAEAILGAHYRKVRVRILTDDLKQADPGSDVGWLRRSGIPVVTDHSDAHMHHKFAVIDGEVLIAGSYNWTRAAARENQDDVMVLRDPAVVSAFAARFELLWDRMSGS